MVHNDDNITELLAWFSEALKRQGSSEKYKTNVVVETPWSAVIKAKVGARYYYLKQTPAALFDEPKIIDFIAKNVPSAAVPEVLLVNQELKAFITSSCGDRSLRTKFNGMIDEALLFKGFESYIQIQRALEEHEALQTLGVPDWRMKRIPELYVELLENKTMLLEEGLTSDEINQLLSRVPAIQSICDSLSRCAIKDTLVNCDFNENNMIINESTQQISLIDWGESVISHPFLSIAAHLGNNARRYHLDLKERPLESIKERCLSCWSDVATQHELNEMYQNVQKILPIFLALGIKVLQDATNNKSKEKQRWFVGGILKALLQEKA